MRCRINRGPTRSPLAPMSSLPVRALFSGDAVALRLPADLPRAFRSDEPLWTSLLEMEGERPHVPPSTSIPTGGETTGATAGLDSCRIPDNEESTAFSGLCTPVSFAWSPVLRVTRSLLTEGPADTAGASASAVRWGG
mmetsp:Transcript_30749/g.60565  ORF Transcript_30749/g.60565 Transcript_30749/m.60565 type:complete len:138 (+) Transcript_30749:742-1155(+)